LHGSCDSQFIVHRKLGRVEGLERKNHTSQLSLELQTHLPRFSNPVGSVRLIEDKLSPALFILSLTKMTAILPSQKAIDFMVPYVEDKDAWPFP